MINAAAPAVILPLNDCPYGAWHRPMINWHRLFGLALSDYFTGTEYAVEMEKDLARKRQVLDILIIRGQGQPLADPCDGLDALRPHNLVTYKSGQESLDAWAIEELTAKWVSTCHTPLRTSVATWPWSWCRNYRPRIACAGFRARIACAGCRSRTACAGSTMRSVPGSRDSWTLRKPANSIIRASADRALIMIPATSLPARLLVRTAAPTDRGPTVGSAVRTNRA